LNEMLKRVTPVCKVLVVLVAGTTTPAVLPMALTRENQNSGPRVAQQKTATHI
jgi:hypothetical protein